MSHSSVKSMDSCGGTQSQGRSVTRHLTPSCKALLTRHGSASAAAPASEQPHNTALSTCKLSRKERLSKSADKVLEGSKHRRDTLAYLRCSLATELPWKEQYGHACLPSQTAWGWPASTQTYSALGNMQQTP